MTALPEKKIMHRKVRKSAAAIGSAPGSDTQKGTAWKPHHWRQREYFMNRSRKLGIKWTPDSEGQTRTRALFMELLVIGIVWNCAFGAVPDAGIPMILLTPKCLCIVSLPETAMKAFADVERAHTGVFSYDFLKDDSILPSSVTVTTTTVPGPTGGVRSQDAAGHVSNVSTAPYHIDRYSLRERLSYHVFARIGSTETFVVRDCRHREPTCA